MIEFNERIFPDGNTFATVRADGLPAGMSYHVQLWPDGRCTAKSKAHGNGSVRYYTHQSYEHALAHGYAWAKRKVAEAKRMRRRNSEAIDEATAALREALLKTPHKKPYS